MWDVLLKNGHVVAPHNKRNGVMDVAIENDRIAAVGEGLTGRARAEDDCAGLLVVPGIIDAHMHLGIYGSPYGVRMSALSGVTTGIDMIGPLDEVMREAHRTGAGLNFAILDRLEPNQRYGTDNPSAVQILQFIDESIAGGALGIKLVGGHWPLTLEACTEAVHLANEKDAYVAWHAGTMTAGSDIEGMRQAVEAVGGMRLHLAHINSYCRGRIRAPELEALELLSAHPNIWSEAYMSPLNGTHLTCDGDGRALDHATKICLGIFGLPDTREAFRRRILVALRDTGYITEIIEGEEACAYWEKMGTKNVVGCFPVNVARSRLMLTEAKRADGTFVLDAMSTDDGCIPRNVIVAMGLNLVKFGVISLSEFVMKPSLTNARHLRLFDRGHFSEGAAADVTVIDFERAKAVETYVGGVVNMKNGVLYGSGMTVITTEAGRRAVGCRMVASNLFNCALKVPLDAYLEKVDFDSAILEKA
ncbi:amidohydrolase family protein [Sutterella sp.]|uniref:amidohydrolase family protein n=1 Tax=Sutterella sp. TaxID=1981025 RepID=UPI003FD7CCE7